MRYLAASFLTWAALDWPAPSLDRVGLIAAGVACLALALPPRPRRIRRAAMPAAPPVTLELAEELDVEASSLAERLADYGHAEPVR